MGYVSAGSWGTGVGNCPLLGTALAFGCPFREMSTCVTEPSESLAVPLTVNVAGAVKVAPFAGLVIETCGGASAVVDGTANDVLWMVVSPLLAPGGVFAHRALERTI